ncbi:hypothetical protein HMPREF0731_0987, partial [Pseudoroseomonas cervicalis ATCC 49957]
MIQAQEGAMMTPIRSMILAGAAAMALVAAAPSAEAHDYYRRGPGPGAVAAGIIGGLA